MEEIRVNEYVRTDKGTIAKIEDEEFDIKYRITTRQPLYLHRIDTINCKFENIVKHSFNIIDLIEKDDYINGCRVYEVEERGITVYQKVENSDVDYNWIPKDEIENVVTKEQFESIKYKVGD